MIYRIGYKFNNFYQYYTRKSIEVLTIHHLGRWRDNFFLLKKYFMLCFLVDTKKTINFAN